MSVVDWSRLSTMPQALKDDAVALAYADGQEYLYPLNGGWVNIADGQHTVGSPQAIVGGTKTHFTADGLGATTDRRFNRKLSPDVWEGSTFAPRSVGDAYTVRLTFLLSTSSNTSGQFIDVSLGIGSGWNTIVAQVRDPLVKSQGVVDFFTISLPIFCLETFGNFGGRFYLTPSHDCTVWNKAVFIQRTFAP